MSTLTGTMTETPTKSRKLVEMNWDRLPECGQSGIFTKIDF